MAIVIPKRTNIAYNADPNHIRIFANENGRLCSIAEDGTITYYAEWVDPSENTFEDFPVTAEILAAKKVTLLHTPIFDTVRFELMQCLDQVEGQGFRVEGNEIKWDGMGLDGYLDETDFIRIHYSYLL